MEPSIIAALLNAGCGGLVLGAFYFFSKTRSDADGLMLDRLDKIVDRHLASEAEGRKQIADLADQNRHLFDRVITVCTSLGTAINELSSNTRANERALQELSASTKANEKAIQDLRVEFRQIGGGVPQPALGREVPLPFESGSSRGLPG